MGLWRQNSWLKSCLCYMLTMWVLLSLICKMENTIIYSDWCVVNAQLFLVTTKLNSGMLSCDFICLFFLLVWSYLIFSIYFFNLNFNKNNILFYLFIFYHQKGFILGCGVKVANQCMQTWQPTYTLRITLKNKYFITIITKNHYSLPNICAPLPSSQHFQPLKLFFCYSAPY